MPHEWWQKRSVISVSRAPIHSLFVFATEKAALTTACAQQHDLYVCMISSACFIAESRSVCIALIFAMFMLYCDAGMVGKTTSQN